MKPVDKCETRVCPGGDVTAGINEIEGYLLAESERACARAEAEAFADHLPWLTSAQHEEVLRHYSTARIALSRHQFEAVATRCVDLRAEYEQRYQALRTTLLRRYLATGLTTMTLTIAALTAICRTGRTPSPPMPRRDRN